MSHQSPSPEYKYNVAAFVIRALTNLHVGAGSDNYGVIDNLVQRDAATGFPCIHASSLKGALKEHCRDTMQWDKDPENKQDVLDYIFGNAKKYGDESRENSGTNGGKKSSEHTVKLSPGRFKFLQADLVSLPARSDRRLYFNTSSGALLHNIINTLNLFGKSPDNVSTTALQSLTSGDLVRKYFADDANDEAVLESVELKVTKSRRQIAIPPWLGEAPAMLSDAYMAALCSDQYLPVIARNYLENGESKNLWYEQILPRETRMFFVMLYPAGNEAAGHFGHFCSALETPVQIGANASVGYGYCDFKTLPLAEPQTNAS